MVTGSNTAVTPAGSAATALPGGQLPALAAGETALGTFFQKGRARARCPHCHCAANCRSSREIAITNRELYYECTNLFCGHAWKSSEIYDHGLRPSAIPNPKIDLKLRVPTRAEALELLRDRDPDQPDMFEAPAPDRAAPDTG